VFESNGGSQEGIWAGAYAYTLADSLPQKMGRLIMNFSTLNISSLGNIHKYASPHRVIFPFFQYLTLPSYDPNTPVNYLTSVYDAVEARGRDMDPDVDVACYPNPFNPVVVISWANSGIAGAIHESPLHNAPKLAIYDTRGRMVHNTGNVNTGHYTWNATGLPAGVYLIQVKAGKRTFIKKTTLLK
jgi:hypothetical protein